MEQCGESITDAVEKYTDLIYRIAYQNLKNRADAEDITQEAFIKLLSAPAFDSETHMKSWLIRVTINLCRDLKKSAWYRKTDALSDSDCPNSSERQKIMDEILRLPNKYSNTLYLYYYEEYTIAEIADILNTNVNTANTWLKRARKKLKDILVEGGVQGDS